jgi:type IV pilus assembly protein PilV
MNASRTRGFTLLEALLTLVVLSIGLLALAGMQNKGLQNNQTAYQRSQAVTMMTDISDRMRANRVEASAGGYDIAYGAPPPAATDCWKTPCTPAALTAFDQAAWKKALAQRLPLGGGAIATAAGVATVTIRWDENHTGATGLNCPAQSALDLSCLQMTVVL